MANAYREAGVKLVAVRPKISTLSSAAEGSERHGHEQVACRGSGASGSGTAHSLDAKDAADVALVLAFAIP